MLMRKNLSDKMKEEAVSLGLCAQWTADWDHECSKDEMVLKFVNGIDFCIARNWPSVEEMKAFFGDVMNKHDVYVDEKVIRKAPETMILNGECEANVETEWMNTSEIYVRHTSMLHLKVRGLSRAFVNLHDAGELYVECDEGSKCFVYQYGGEIVKKTGSVVIRDRHDFKFK